MKRKKAVIVTNIIFLLAELIGLIYSIKEYGWGMFRYYTQDSNYFASITSIILLIYLFRNKELPSKLIKARYVAMLSLVITFVITAVVLAPKYGQDYFLMFTDGSKLYQHTFGPILYFISFFAFERKVPKEMKCICCGILPTAIYAVVLVTLNILHIEDGPYPFLRVYNQPIYMSVFWVVVIFGFALAVAWAVWKLGRCSQKRECEQ